MVIVLGRSHTDRHKDATEPKHAQVEDAVDE
jgi:hypothetical protein